MQPAIDFARDPRSGLYVPEDLPRRKGQIVDARYLFHRRRALRAAGGGEVNTSWSDWDELSETGWTGSSTNTNICFFEGDTTADEISQGGGLAGADLVLSLEGTVEASSGTPPSRHLDGVTGRFSATATYGGMLDSNTGAWTRIIKLHDFAAGANQALCDSDNGGSDHAIRIWRNTAGDSSFEVYDYSGGAYRLNATTTAGIPTAGDVWVCLWYDGTYFRGGWATSKPTKWTDFAANNRVSQTTTSTSNEVALRYGSKNDGTDYYADVYLYYVLQSTDCLIDNAS